MKLIRRYRVLKDSPLAKRGEIGIALRNDFPKYDLKLDLGKASVHLFGRDIIAVRHVYFYKKRSGSPSSDSNSISQNLKENK